MNTYTALPVYDVVLRQSVVFSHQMYQVSCFGVGA